MYSYLYKKSDNYYFTVINKVKQKFGSNEMVHRRTDVKYEKLTF